MIDLVTGVLQSQGLVTADRFDACNVYVGKNLVFHVYDRSGNFVVVKALEEGESEVEFTAMQRAYSAMPELVPRPLALDRTGGRPLLMIEGVAHEALSSQMIDRHGKALSTAMCRFIDGAAAHFREHDGRRTHSAMLFDLIEALEPPEAAALRHVANGLDMAALDRLPHIAQHGDLVINNLGRTGRGMVIFDWEDFARVTLPGFDVALLLGSCLMHDMNRLEHLFETGQPAELDVILRHLCSGGIDRDLFRMLVPVYYGAFQNIKRSMGYGAEIIGICQRNILGSVDRRPDTA